MKSGMVRFLRACFFLVAPVVVVIATLVLWGGFATRPVNPPLGRSYASTGLQFERLEHNRGDQQDLVVLAFSGGGTRAAALAYGLYGDKLFDQYEDRFLARDVQGELVHRALNPLHWGALMSKGWGVSEMAAQLYDEILFHGATFADLNHEGVPAIAVGAT